MELQIDQVIWLQKLQRFYTGLKSTEADLSSRILKFKCMNLAPVKLVVFDRDGTLLNDAHQVSPDF